ncbi:hypothetical protein HPB47_011855, partial [Ixodes persulcatus]
PPGPGKPRMAGGTIAGLKRAISTVLRSSQMAWLMGNEDCARRARRVLVAENIMSVHRAFAAGTSG